MARVAIAWDWPHHDDPWEDFFDLLCGYRDDPLMLRYYAMAGWIAETQVEFSLECAESECRLGFSYRLYYWDLDDLAAVECTLRFGQIGADPDGESGTVDG